MGYLYAWYILNYFMEKTMQFTFNEQELNIVFNALAQRPYAEVFQLVAKIQQEAQSQLKENENG